MHSNLSYVNKIPAGYKIQLLHWNKTVSNQFLLKHSGEESRARKAVRRASGVATLVDPLEIKDMYYVYTRHEIHVVPQLELKQRDWKVLHAQS